MAEPTDDASETAEQAGGVAEESADVEATDPAGEKGALETVRVGERWVTRVGATQVVVSVNLTRTTAIGAGAALARTWSVRHHVVYHSP